jgi:hypothetical protein
MTLDSPTTTAPRAPERDAALRLTCLPAGACYVCARDMVRSSGGKWLCKSCGFVLTCCDS